MLRYADGTGHSSAPREEPEPRATSVRISLRSHALLDLQAQKWPVNASSRRMMRYQLLDHPVDDGDECLLDATGERLGSIGIGETCETYMAVVTDGAVTIG